MDTHGAASEPRALAAAATAEAAARAPRILIRTEVGAQVPYFDAAPQQAAGVDGSYVMERRFIEPGSLGAHTFDDHVLMLPLGPRAIRCESRLEGRTLGGLVEPRRLRFLARGDSLATSWYGAVDALFLTVSPTLFSTALGEAAPAGSVMLASRMHSHQDDVLEHLMLALLAYVSGRCGGGRLFEQSLLGAIAHRMATAYATGRRGDVHGPQLPQWKHKRLVDYIHDNIAADFHLKDLAAVAGMSPYHLARAFRASTGDSLWHYVLECRARHALQFIGCHPDAVLADVAAVCGFESYAQFIAAFRRVHGLLPSEYRRSLARRH